MQAQRSCNDGSTSYWCCSAYGKHDSTTLKLYLARPKGGGAPYIVELCRDQIDNAATYWSMNTLQLIEQLPHLCRVCFRDFPELQINQPDGTLLCAHCCP